MAYTRGYEGEESARYDPEEEIRERVEKAQRLLKEAQILAVWNGIDFKFELNEVKEQEAWDSSYCPRY